MARETWGTFAVRDHLLRRAFVADVLLYDRLVIPFPDDEQERGRWRQEGWEPDVLEKKLDILGDGLVQLIPWSSAKREQFADRIKAAQAVQFDTDNLAECAAQGIDPWAMTRMILVDDVGGWKDQQFVAQLPGVYVDAVAAYPSYDAYRADVPNTDGPPNSRVVGWEIIVPEDSTLDDDTLLKEAVKLACDETFREKRAAFNAWRREMVELEASAQNIRADLTSRLQEYRAAMKRVEVRTRVLNAFAVVGIGASIAGGVLFPPITVAGGFISAGRFVAEKTLNVPNISDRAKAVAIIHDGRRRFGWR